MSVAKSVRVGGGSISQSHQATCSITRLRWLILAERLSRVFLLLLLLLWRFAALEIQSMDRDLFEGLDPTRSRGRILGATFPNEDPISSLKSAVKRQSCHASHLVRLSSLLETSIHSFVHSSNHSFNYTSSDSYIHPFTH